MHGVLDVGCGQEYRQGLGLSAVVNTAPTSEESSYSSEVTLLLAPEWHESSCDSLRQYCVLVRTA